MDGWTIGLAAGLVVILVLCVLMTVVVRTAAGTVAKAKEVLALLEVVQAETAALAGLDDISPRDGTDPSKAPASEEGER